MASATDYTALQAQAVEVGKGEAVTVNIRELISKILSRYSGTWSKLRELIQNAADARATRVVIKIETTPSVKVPSPESDDSSTRLTHVLQHHTIKRWVIENNGERFTRDDWSRLTQIAKGNPDPDKIGAFGVGFYTVFDNCDEPFVSSGSQALQFYFIGDALYTKTFEHSFLKSTDTIFILPVRDKKSSVPQGQKLLSLCQFLTGSMTFVGLESIELWVDKWRILFLQRSTADSVNLDIPQSISRNTSKGLMQISRITQEVVQLEAEWIGALGGSSKPSKLPSGIGVDAFIEPAKKSLFSFFKKGTEPPSQSSDEPPQGAKRTENTTAKDITAAFRQKTFFHIDKAYIQTSVDADLGAEFLRSRRKPPPSTTAVSCMSQSYEERAATNSAAPAVASQLFNSVVPTTKGQVYIGFTTSQMPTVEREQIDLNSQHIKTWNSELLRAAGIVARISWSTTMARLQQQISRLDNIVEGKALAPKELERLLPTATFLCETFNWSSTTPLPGVGEEIESAFWSCSNDFKLLSSRGIVPIENIRTTSVDVSFVDELPVIPAQLFDVGLVKRLRESGYLRDVEVEDIVWILEKSKKTRTPTQLQQLLAFIAKKARANQISRGEIRSILDAAVVTDGEDGSNQIIALSQVQEYVNPDKIPPNMPVPPSTIPFRYTKTLSKLDTDALGFRELHPVNWLRWLLEDRNVKGQLSTEQNMEINPAFATNVLRVLSKQWAGLSQEAKTMTTTLLENRTVIPTKMGMKKPSEAYFPSVKLFQDLPVVLDLTNFKELFLAALGVRKTLEIGVVFERLVNSTSQGAKPGVKWSHVDLIKYLVSVWADVPKGDRERLKQTPVCPAEVSKGEASERVFRISELYEPSDSLRRLGLRTLQWPGHFSPESREGKLLQSLGLRNAPPYADLINIIATASQSKNIPLRDFALRYFVENYQSKGYDTSVPANVKVPFLPIQGSEDKLSTPSNCFTNERATLLRFDLLRSDLHRHALQFGVQPDPPMDRCIQRLIREPPQNERQARNIFAYMTSRIGSITKQHVNTLGEAKIVPFATSSNNSDEKGNRVRLLSPRECFLGDGGDFARIFDFVDFSPEANMFLLHCGSRHRPETLDLAHLLAQQPGRFLKESGDKKYEEILLTLSRAWDTLKEDKSLVGMMKQAPFLLASRWVDSDASDKNQEDEEGGETGKNIWHLAKPSDIIIVDEVINYDIFKAHILAAPQKDELEALYLKLGTPVLSSLITQRQNTGDPLPDQSVAFKLQSIILERAPLYLHDYQKDLVRHDAKWLEKNLSVQATRRITVRKWLKGLDVPHEESKTATLRRGDTRSYILLVTNDYDMLQVSQVLASLMLHRSKPTDVLSLRSVLQSSLRSLQQLGFNVEKRLRQNEKDVKIAQEAYQQRLEQEQRAQKDREALQQQLQAQRGLDDHQQNPMPGQFTDSSDGKEDIAEGTQQPESFLEGIGKRFGFDFGRKSSPALANGDRDMNATRDHELDYPKPESEPGVPRPPRQETPRDEPPLTKPPPKPLTPQELDARVQTAMHTSRPHTSSNVKSKPEVHKVEEMHTMCDPRPGLNLVHIGDLSGLRVFIDEVISSQSKAKFIENNRPGLEQFASVLRECAIIYRLQLQVINIFYDGSGGTTAFNQSAFNSLFFNYRCFKELGHLDMMRHGNKADPINSWALTMAHELAHNVEPSHNTLFQNVMQTINEKHTFRITEIAKGQPSIARQAPAANTQPPKKGPYVQTFKR
ncbi:MAG: hypothetical protein Q9201_004089 [Fulgogasparrea decipioides]